MDYKIQFEGFDIKVTAKEDGGKIEYSFCLQEKAMQDLEICKNEK